MDVALSLKAYILTHKHCPLEVIGSLDERKEEFYDKLRGLSKGIVIVSTCNRFEVYADTPSVQFENKLRELLGEASNHMRVLENLDAIRHLIEVASGLDSQIIGEHEILGQVRESWKQGRKLGLTSRVLDQVIARALRAARRVRRETRIGYGVVGYPQAGIELLSRRLGGLDGKRIMIVGAGQAGESALKHLCKKYNPAKVILANRTIERALALRSLCPEHSLEVVGLDKVKSLLGEVDGVFAAISGGISLIKATEVESTRVIIVDISLPPVVERVPGRVLFMEDVKSLVDESLSVRLNAIPHAQAIVEEELAKIKLFMDRLPVELMIAEIMRRARDMYLREIARAQKKGENLTPRELSIILDSYTRKILRPLLLFMRSKVYNGNTDALRELYSFYLGEFERMIRGGCRRIPDNKTQETQTHS